MRTLARSRTAFLLAAITCGFAACFMTLGLAAASASSGPSLIGSSPDGSYRYYGGVVTLPGDYSPADPTDWSLCVAETPLTFEGLDSCTFADPVPGGTYVASWSAGDVPPPYPAGWASASAPSASSASDPLNGADDTIWTQLGGGLHHPIMAFGFPLAVVSLAIGLVLKWVRRAVAA